MVEHNPPAGLSDHEKLMALFSHIFSLFAAPVLYFTIKDSKFVRFHSLQSAIFNWIAFILFSVCIFIPVILIQFYNDPSMGCIIFLSFAVGFIVAAGSTVYSIIIGVFAFQGKLMEYPLCGRWAFNRIYS